jgi:hypothetical protein
MQPAKMTHMTSTARQTNVISTPFGVDRAQRGVPGRRVAYARSPRQLAHGRSALEGHYAGLNALLQKAPAARARRDDGLPAGQAGKFPIWGFWLLGRDRVVRVRF